MKNRELPGSTENGFYQYNLQRRIKLGSSVSDTIVDVTV